MLNGGGLIFKRKGSTSVNKDKKKKKPSKPSKKVSAASRGNMCFIANSSTYTRVRFSDNPAFTLQKNMKGPLRKALQVSKSTLSQNLHEHLGWAKPPKDPNQDGEYISSDDDGNQEEGVMITPETILEQIPQIQGNSKINWNN